MLGTQISLLTVPFAGLLTGTRESEMASGTFFFYCPVTFRLLQQWGAIFEPPFNPNHPSFLQLYWYGAVDEEPHFNPTAIIFICDCFKYVLWKFKQRRKIPNFVSFRSQLLGIIYNSSCLNKSLKLGIQNNNLIANFLQARG